MKSLIAIRNINLLQTMSVSLVICLSLSSCGQAPPEGTSDESAKSKAERTELPTVPTVKVELKQLNTKMDLPGQLEAYQDVPIHAKVEGFIEWINVDRGSKVKQGEAMIKISAPELDEKMNEAAAKVSGAQASLRQSESALQSEISTQLESRAKFEADSLTLQRLQQAAKTPGAIAQNEVDMAQKTAEADQDRLESLKSSVMAARALVNSEEQNVRAAKSVLESFKAMDTYLTLRAPFDGVVTERNVHQGSIVAVDPSRRDKPLVRVQEKSVLRLVVAVPEDAVAGVKAGSQIPFNVPAFLGKTFYGTIARLGYALDEKTRTMPVELDVANPDGSLEPGMFATVSWKVTRPYPTLFVPSPAVDTDLNGTFVVRIVNGACQRVTVKRGQSMGDLVEIVGDLSAGDEVALKATDELKTGTRLIAKAASQADIDKALEHNSSGGE